MDSKIGLIIQFISITLIAIMSLFLHRSLKTIASGYWAFGWSSLSLALLSLSFAFNYESVFHAFLTIYFFAEYVFGLMLIFGCLSLSGNFRLKTRHKLLFIPFAVIAVVFAYVTKDLNFIFNAHSFVIGSFFLSAFYLLKRVQIGTFGWRLMCFSLLALAIDFFHYTIIFTLLHINPDLLPPVSYLAFEPIFDLVLEILLGFGMVIVLLEKVLQKLQDANAKLEHTQAKLEQIAHIDPLTTAFNRHAFYGLLNKRDENQDVISGCVGFFDIDDLKPINDRFGHQAGDMAIRAVVGAIRNVMRAEDLIYRWGGDEFFVIMVGMSEEMTLQRMQALELMLTDIFIDGVNIPLTICVSFGFKDFTDITNLEQAIKSADEEMYRRKQENKQKRMHVQNGSFRSNENTFVSLNR
jgi:diguanylate cyclase (GGDEF)-like protein